MIHVPLPPVVAALEGRCTKCPEFESRIRSAENAGKREGAEGWRDALDWHLRHDAPHRKDT